MRDEVDGELLIGMTFVENAVFEFLYNFAGFPNKIKGAKRSMDWFGGYTNRSIKLPINLRVYKSANPWINEKILEL